MTDASDTLATPVLGVYCERGVDPAFWAEPLNALTNAAFIVASVAMAGRARADRAVLALAAVTFAIGIGSFLFHTLATRGAMLADVIPIQLFIALYFFFAMRRFFGLGPWAALAATLAFMAAAALAPALLPAYEPWRGLGGYVGGLLGLVGVAAALTLRGGQAKTASRLATVAGLFLVSLGFRTIDGAICAEFELGSHAVWHVLNAAVLYLLGKTLAETPRFRPNRTVT